MYYTSSEVEGAFDGPGRWMGTQLFNSETEARDALALLPDFKKEGYPLVIREYEVIKPIKARKGIVGALTSKSSGKNYSGGAEQIQLLDNINFSPTWENYFKHSGFVDNDKKIRSYIKLLN